jgi:uncharacterized transporter YbjL
VRSFLKIFIQEPLCREFEHDRRIAFSVFIYAVGYDSGPGFFNSLNRKTIREIVMALFLVISSLITVIICTKIFHLNKGHRHGGRCDRASRAAAPLRYDNAAILAGAMAGSRSANPAFGGVLDKAESAVPTVPFAITYAIANVLLLGPLVSGWSRTQR